ncbi:TorF family putative porin [Candidatus Rariloculus sp.]|uniref:TorF family putative porin n=1 Tax=Candidatus Rariloculus sp. TaxID=3101265 RepID=UPI003D0F5D39
MKRKVTLAIALLGLSAVPAVSMAQWSANVGWVSDYVYRGYYQEDSSASAGIDYENDSGFYIGTWGADVGDGMETDVYFGYGGGSGDFGWSIGYTGYLYTDDFDDTYTEVNLGFSYGIFALDFASGEWDGFGAPEDYTFTSITLSPASGPYFTFGSFGKDFDGDYFELGYGLDVNGVDLSIALIQSDELPVTSDGGEWQLVLGLSKSIDIGGSD